MPRSSLSFGATGRIAQLPFDTAQVSLDEAVARLGGLNDERANPEGVCLFRFEDVQDTQAIGIEVPLGVMAPSETPDTLPQGISIVYHVNMRDPQSYFALQRFHDARHGRHLHCQRADGINLQVLAADLNGRLTGSDGESVDAIAALRGSYTC